MKNLLLSLVVLLSLTSCLANKVANTTLLPLARTVWPNVRVDYSIGLDDAVAKNELNADQRVVLDGYADKLDTALKNGDSIALMTIPWESIMRPYADRGIGAEVAAGKLGPNGAKILFQRVADFTDVLNALQGKRVARLELNTTTDWRLAQLVDHEVQVWANR